MAIDLESLGVHQLSVPERLSLIEQIWETLPGEVDPSEVPEWHRAELAKRRSQVDRHTAQGSPWREVIGRLEGSP